LQNKGVEGVQEYVTKAEFDKLSEVLPALRNDRLKREATLRQLRRNQGEE
jgi:hypothetical protein